MAPLVEGYRGAEHVVGPLHVASVNWLLMAATFPVKKEARASAVRQDLWTGSSPPCLVTSCAPDFLRAPFTSQNVQFQEVRKVLRECRVVG
ncbi:hypothetical protein SRHO_G00297240 [Serrasalmus rhombeus]